MPVNSDPASICGFTEYATSWHLFTERVKDPNFIWNLGLWRCGTATSNIGAVGGGYGMRQSQVWIENLSFRWELMVHTRLPRTQENNLCPFRRRSQQTSFKIVFAQRGFFFCPSVISRLPILACVLPPPLPQDVVKTFFIKIDVNSLF